MMKNGSSEQLKLQELNIQSVKEKEKLIKRIRFQLILKDWEQVVRFSTQMFLLYPTRMQ